MKIALRSKLKRIEKNIISLRKILYQERKDTLIWFFIAVFLDIGSQVMIVSHDQEMENFLQNLVSDIIPPVLV